MAAATEGKKVFVLDTSVLIHDPETIANLRDNVIVVPFVVLEELDKKKTDGNGSAAAARHAIRNLDRIFNSVGGLPTSGIPLAGGGFLFVDNKVYFPKGGPQLDVSVNDNRIIGTALRWMRAKDEKQSPAEKQFFLRMKQRFAVRDVILISKDVNLRVKARACGLKTEDYQKDRLVASEADLYTGIVRMPIGKGEIDLIEAGFYEGRIKGNVPRSDVESIVKLPELLPNACCIFENDDRNILALYRAPEKEGGEPYFRLVPQSKVPAGGGRKIRPRNIGQSFAYAMSADPSISLVALSGFAGSGKTLMALTAGLDQTKPDNGRGWYRQIIVCRPTQELGNSIGYLKGTLADKMSPWARPIVDALELISSGREREAFETEDKQKVFTLDELLNDSLASPVKVEPANFMQGRSLHHRLLIVDEVQNFRPGDVKKLITRAGKGSKVILVGDVEQVESPYLDAVSNGLSYVIERMKGQPTFGHITLWESERSPLAELAAKLL
jgi:PhoH-like ATPase